MIPAYPGLVIVGQAVYLALLLGASVNAGPAMTLYHTVDGEHIRSVRLPA